MRGLEATQELAPGESFPEKLVKYIPGEVVAFLVPYAAFVGLERRTLLIAGLAAGAIATFIYLWASANRLPKEQRPRPYFYVLAEVAYIVWAICVPPSLVALVGFDAITAGALFLLMVFLVPALDTLFERVFTGQATPDSQPSG
jgi:hypothetical protein